MKKIFATVVAASMMLVGTGAFAQINRDNLSVGAGWVNSTLSHKSAGSDNFNGIYLGLSYDIPVASVAGLSVEPGLYWEHFSTGGDVRQNESYLQIPVMAKYSFDLASDTRFFVYAGPTLSAGLTSKLKNTAGGSTVSTNLYGSDSDYGRFDVLIGLGAGVDLMEHYRIKLGYSYGLVNRYTGSLDAALHRSEVTLGVAYLF